MEDYQDIREHILIDRRHGGPYDREYADEREYNDDWYEDQYDLGDY